MAKKWYKRASCKQQTRKQKKRAEEQARWTRLHAEMEAAGYTENTMKRIGEVKNMKLNIQNIIWIGEPEIGGELEIATYGRIFDVEIVKERMSFQGMDFGVRPAVVKATTTSADAMNGLFGPTSKMRPPSKLENLIPCTELKSFVRSLPYHKPLIWKP